MRSGDGAEVVAFASAAEFVAWLEAHAGLRAGVWLKLAKQGSGVPSMTSDEAVDVGLCFGWISGQRKAHDAVFYLQKYVPRRPRSRWSQVNVAKVEALLAAGKMRPSGLAEVAAAQADGRWAAAYASQRDATVPPDLARGGAGGQPGGGARVRGAREDAAVRADPRPRHRAHGEGPAAAARPGDGRARWTCPGGHAARGRGLSRRGAT